MHPTHKYTHACTRRGCRQHLFNQRPPGEHSCRHRRRQLVHSTRCVYACSHARAHLPSSSLFSHGTRSRARCAQGPNDDSYSADFDMRELPMSGEIWSSFYRGVLLLARALNTTTHPLPAPPASFPAPVCTRVRSGSRAGNGPSGDSSAPPRHHCCAATDAHNAFCLPYT